MTSNDELKKLFDVRPETRELIASQHRITVSADLKGRVIPLFTMSRGKAGVIWGVRNDVPKEVAVRLALLTREERPIRDFEEPPLYADAYQSLLGGRVVSGPAFGFSSSQVLSLGTRCGLS
jgi:hypothetical protein